MANSASIDELGRRILNALEQWWNARCPNHDVKLREENCGARAQGLQLSQGFALLVFFLFAAGVGSATPTRAQESSTRAIAYYADAASFQNNGAFDLAVAEWKKLLSEFPNDPLASKASHYLGVCYGNLNPPQYDDAISALRTSLKDTKLDIRDETLIRIAELLFAKGREQESTASQKSAYAEARNYLSEFLKDYGSRSAADRALFVLGEIEYAQGDTVRSIAYHEKLIGDPRFKDSKLLPDARYAVAVAREELQEFGRAERGYREFLAAHPSHRLVEEVTVRLADVYLRGNKLDEAEKLLAKLVGSSNEVADYAILRLAYTLSQRGDNQRAISYYEDLLARFPNSRHAPAATLSLGQLLASDGRDEEAKLQFQKLISQQDDQAAQALHWLATILLKQNKAAEAEQQLDSEKNWSRGSASAVDLQMDYADALYAQPSKLEASRREYEKIATDHQDHPLAPRATYNAAFGALQAGNQGQARKWAELFLAKYPQDPLRSDVAYVAAEALLQQGEHKAAAQAYEKLLATDRDNPARDLWLLRQAMAHYLGGEYDPAIGLLDDAHNQLGTPEQRAEALFILGASRLYKQELGAAIANFIASRRASEKWSSADEVLLLLAEAQQRTGDKSAAKKTLERLLEQYPKTRLKQQVAYKLAQLSAAIGDYENAISGYRAVTKDPDAQSFHRFAQYGIAWSMMQQEDFASALVELEPLLKSSTVDTIQHQALLAEGVCLRKTGATRKAIDSLSKFLDTQPKGLSLGNGLYELGLAYTELKDTTNANKAFEQILTSVPDYPSVDKVLYELGWNAAEQADASADNLYFARLAREFPNSEFAPEATYMLAQKEYDAGDFRDAAKLYQQVLDKTQELPLLEKTLYKLGWCQFKLEDYEQASATFFRQGERFPTGELAIDAAFMGAECEFNQDKFDAALAGYKNARQKLDSGAASTATDQVKALIYLHGAQCYRERKDWQECAQWLDIVLKNYADSPYAAVAKYEMGYCLQNQNKTKEALDLYNQVADSNPRAEIGARSRFMSGEVFFAKRDFVAAIREFQRVMYGFGAGNAPDEIKNWQAKAAFEAARCTEVLAEDRQGSDRKQLLSKAQEYYDFIIQQHGSHDLAAKAQSRLGELRSLR